MVLPRPWCTKDPRPCVKAVGIVEIILSVIGGVLLIVLPFIMLNLDHEVTYIKQHHHGIDKTDVVGAGHDKAWFALNITDTYRYDCNVLKQALEQYLAEFLKGKFKYIVTINSSKPITEVDANNATISSRIRCEILVHTKRRPTTHLVEVKNVRYSVADICALCISDYTKEPIASVKETFSVITPSSNEIASQRIYPGAVGNDPERVACINQVIRDATKAEVLATENLMYKFMGTAVIFSVIAGFLVTSNAFIVSRTLLMLTFLMEIICIAFMAAALVVVNNPTLCLFQYGGISEYAQDSPTQMQTVITYCTAAYAAFYKFYVLWFIIAYCEMANSLKADEEPPAYSDYVAEMAVEINLLNQERGGENADSELGEGPEDSESDSDEFLPKKDFKSNNLPKVPLKKGQEKGGKGEMNVKRRKSRTVSFSQPPSGNDDDNDDEDDTVLFMNRSKGNVSSSTTGTGTTTESSGTSLAKPRPRPAAARRQNRGPEHSLLPQQRDKKIFQGSFFGSHHI